MMGKRFARIVEECLHRLDRGENLPDVLADYPAESEHLKPLLLVAMAGRSMALPVPSQSAQRLGKNQMLSAMDLAGSSSTLKDNPFLQRARLWSTRQVNKLRAQYLIRRAPSYRLAIIGLLVVFGSGLFALSASASPDDLLTAFMADIQGVMDIFNRDPSERSQDFFNLFSFFSDNDPLYTANRGSKVAFQLDYPDETDNPGITKNTDGGNPSPHSPDNDPGEPAGGIPDEDSDPEKPIYPTPFPGNAVNVVNEVVSDTAKEKNPVWDQLPFNQTDQDPSDEGDDQEESEIETAEDLKDAEKEAEKDLKDAEKEAEKDLKEAEKDQKDLDKITE
jgi:hypothetical protein